MEPITPEYSIPVDQAIEILSIARWGDGSSRKINYTTLWRWTVFLGIAFSKDDPLTNVDVDRLQKLALWLARGNQMKNYKENHESI